MDLKLCNREFVQLCPFDSLLFFSVCTIYKSDHPRGEDLSFSYDEKAVNATRFCVEKSFVFKVLRLKTCEKVCFESSLLSSYCEKSPIGFHGNHLFIINIILVYQD